MQNGRTARHEQLVIPAGGDTADATVDESARLPAAIVDDEQPTTRPRDGSEQAAVAITAEGGRRRDEGGHVHGGLSPVEAPGLVGIAVNGARASVTAVSGMMAAVLSKPAARLMSLPDGAGSGWWSPALSVRTWIQVILRSGNLR